MLGSQRVSLQNGFLLHRRNWRETSLLLDFFTLDYGILRLIAKGALRGRQPRFGVCQPFIPLCLSWTGKSELPLLTSLESLGAGFNLQGKALFCGFYLNELLMRLVPPHDPHPKLMVSYQDALARLADDAQFDPVLRLFELSLLEEIGYGLTLDEDCESGGPVHPDKHYLYDVETGPREAVAGPGTLRGSTLLALQQRDLSGAMAFAEAKSLLRRVIQHYLGGRPLKSRELFKSFNSN